MRNFVTPVAVIIVLLLAPWAHAGPAYYAVTGVTPDDTLNVRMSPNGRAEIIGTLAHNASPIEIIRIENGWGMFPAAKVSQHDLERTGMELRLGGAAAGARAGQQDPRDLQQGPVHRWPARDAHSVVGHALSDRR